MFPGCPNLKFLVLVDYISFWDCFYSNNLELTFPEVKLLTPTLKTVNFINVLPTVKSDSEFSFLHKVLNFFLIQIKVIYKYKKLRNGSNT